jgi:hypothetical protein
MSNTTAEFYDIINANFPLEDPDMPSLNMPALTPGEGGAFGLAALLVGAGLVADLHLYVQLAAIGGGVLLGCVGAVTTGRIRAARNEHGAVMAAAEAEVQVAFAHGIGDDTDPED